MGSRVVRPAGTLKRFGRAALPAAVLASALVGSPAPARIQEPPGAPRSVIVRGSESMIEVGRALAEDPSTWRPFPGIGTLAEVGVDSLEIWLVPDLGRDLPPGLRHQEPWVSGTADPMQRRIALRSGPGLGGAAGLRVVLRHELAHVALGAATRGNHSRWLTEGYAQYVSGEWGLEDAWQLQSAFLRRGATSLGEIDLRFRRHPTDAQLGYLLSYTAVHEIEAMGGEPGLHALFRRLSQGVSFDDAFWRTFGITVDAFEVRWKRSLVDRYGWLYLMSRAGVFWGGVTLLVMAVAIRRFRRDRRRLEELRAEDARLPDDALPLGGVGGLHQPGPPDRGAPGEKTAEWPGKPRPD